jgi:hypothetical protein
MRWLLAGFGSHDAPASRRTSAITTRINPLKYCISWFFDMEALLAVMLLLKKQ